MFRHFASTLGLSTLDTVIEHMSRVHGVYAWSLLACHGAVRSELDGLRAQREQAIAQLAVDACARILGLLTPESHAEALATLSLRFKREDEFGIGDFRAEFEARCWRGFARSLEMTS